MVRCGRIALLARNIGLLRTLRGMTNPAGPRQVSPLARAALAVLQTVRLEVDTMRADAEAAVRDRAGGGRSADAQRDIAERAARLTAEHAGAERVLLLLGRLARG